GHRSLVNPNPLIEKPRVLVVGDSQTAGEEVDDVFAWPTILQQLRQDEDIINLGVGGYGLTQMIITLDEEVKNWKPKNIVIAVITDDLYRSALTFRSAKMPSVVLDNNNLV